MLVVKNPPANAGGLREVSSIPGLQRSPGGGCGNPLQCSCLENPHGQRSLAGYSPRGRTASDTTERLSTGSSWEQQPLLPGEKQLQPSHFEGVHPTSF